MIVVVGTLIWDPAAGRPAGRASGIAIAAARNAAKVQVVDRVGLDGPGDALLFELARLGVGHVAVLRDATSSTIAIAGPSEPRGVLDEAADDRHVERVVSRLEPADVDLALRYLSDVAVIVITDDVQAAITDVAHEAAAFAAAHLVLLTALEGSAMPVDAAAATVLAAPATNAADGFDELVGRYAAALDSGVPAREAFGDAFRTLQVSIGA